MLRTKLIVALCSLTLLFSGCAFHARDRRGNSVHAEAGPRHVQVEVTKRGRHHHH